MMHNERTNQTEPFNGKRLNLKSKSTRLSKMDSQKNTSMSFVLKYVLNLILKRIFSNTTNNDYCHFYRFYFYGYY